MPVAALPPATHHMGRPRHRRSATLPTRLPNIVPSSTLISPIISDLSPTKRIDVLHPPTVPRRTVSLETAESQFHMHRRCVLMRQQQWMREHGQWQKPMYGTPAVKECYRNEIRLTLKSQMDDRRRLRENNWLNSVQESIVVANRDHYDNMMDAKKRRDHFNFLYTFTKANKEMMESRWKMKKEEKKLENKRDSEQLMYNPINWSHTLK